MLHVSVREAEAEKTAISEKLRSMKEEISQLEHKRDVMMKAKVERVTKPLGDFVDQLTTPRAKGAAGPSGHTPGGRELTSPRA